MSETMSGEHRRPAWVDLSLALSLAAAVIGFINVWSFAHGNTETLQVMLGAGGLGWTFTIWLAASIPVLLAASWLLLAVMLGEGLREDDPWIQPLLALGFAVFLGLMLVPRLFALALVVFTIFQVAYGMMAKLWRHWATRSRGRKVPWLLRRSGGRRYRLFARGYFALALVGALFLSVIWAPPWIAKELIELKDGGTVVGYTVDEQSEFLLFVEDDSRKPIIVRSSDVRDRTFCRPVWRGQSLLAAWLWSEPQQSGPC